MNRTGGEEGNGRGRVGREGFGLGVSEIEEEIHKKD
jgi:hypothetical protein